MTLSVGPTDVGRGDRFIPNPSAMDMSNASYMLHSQAGTNPAAGLGYREHWQEALGQCLGAQSNPKPRRVSFSSVGKVWEYVPHRWDTKPIEKYFIFHIPRVSFGSVELLEYVPSRLCTDLEGITIRRDCFPFREFQQNSKRRKVLLVRLLLDISLKSELQYRGYELQTAAFFIQREARHWMAKMRNGGKVQPVFSRCERSHSWKMRTERGSQGQAMQVPRKGRWSSRDFEGCVSPTDMTQLVYGLGQLRDDRLMIITLN